MMARRIKASRRSGLLASVLLIGTGSLAAILLLGGGSRAAEHFGAPRAESSASGPVKGETYAWRHVAIGGGGFITGLAFDARGMTRLARTDVYGAYIWQNDRWRQLVNASSMPVEDRHQNGASEGVYEIAVAPSDPDRLYMAIQGWVYRSTDRGRHWIRAAQGAPFPLQFDANSRYRMYGPFMAVDPANPDIVLLGTPSAGLWRSADGGQHWSPVQTVPASARIATKAGDLTAARQAPGALIWFEGRSGGRRVWVLSPGQGMFVSGDAGAHFDPLAASDAAAPKLLRRGAFAPDGSFFGVDSEGRTAWMYRNGRWSNLTKESKLEPRAYAAVAINPHTGMIFLFDEGGRGSRSTDAGESWTRFVHKAGVGEGDPPWLRVADQNYFATADVEFDPAQQNRLWVGAGTGVFHAEPALDGLLVHWMSQARGIEELVANDVTQSVGMPPAFASWDFGIHVKSDLDRYSTTYGPRERVIIAAQQVASTSADPEFLATNASDTRMGCCTEDGQSVLAGYSTDGGRSWQRFASLPEPPGTKSDDPWRMSFGMIAVSAGSVDNIVWAPSFNRSPFYTMDRGKSWSRVVLPGEVLPFTGSHSNYYLPRKTLAADRTLPGVFYLVHSGEGANKALMGLWRTEDGGAHWSKRFDGEIAPQSRFAAKLRTVPGKAGHLFFTSGVADGDDTVLRRSRDGGKTWSRVEGVDHVDDVGFGKAAKASNYPTIFVSGRVRGDYGIWRSIDDAAHWQKIARFPTGTLDQVSVVGGDPNVFGRVYLGYKGSAWIYGEPAPCHSSAGASSVDDDCILVGP